MGNDYLKYGLIAGAGIALGALGVVALSKDKVDLKKMCTTLISYGMDFKEKTATVMETARENMEDIVAEAAQESQKRKESAEEPCEAKA